MKELEKFLESELKALELKEADWGHLTIEDDSRKRILLDVQSIVKNLTIQRVSNLLNCDHEWKYDTFDCYGFPTEKYCEKCGEKQAI